MAVRAKFKVYNLQTDRNDKGEAVQQQVWLMPVYSPDPDSPNHSWSKWTPSGSLTMTITNPDAFDKFEVEKEYYLDFTLAESAPSV